MFRRIYFAQVQAVQSVTSEGGETRSSPMWEGVVDRTGRNWGFHYNVIGIGPRFQTDNGFVPRTGYVQPSFSNRFTVYGRPGGLFERYNVFATTAGLWRYADFFAGRSVLEDRVSASNQITLRGGWSVNVNPTLASFAFDPASYGGLFVNRNANDAGIVPFVPSARIATLTSAYSISTPQFRRFFASVGGSIGNDVDFAETSRARGGATTTPRSTCARATGCA
ncbi:hypothetical protein [Gemmatirosa kalamazoonensis]|uniref:hypothetical protein n=1 Tax=Gemmatirosa kalamazoonensis TaxID=861299 RepID=UPI0004BB4C2C|nr:hypothetical protein [Gemmatirosa kalamazoonensis]